MLKAGGLPARRACSQILYCRLLTLGKQRIRLISPDWRSSLKLLRPARFRFYARPLKGRRSRFRAVCCRLRSPLEIPRCHFGHTRQSRPLTARWQLRAA